MAISVVVAVGDVADPLVEALKARLPKIKVGPGTDPEAEMGPLVTREHRDKVASLPRFGPGAGRRRSWSTAGSTSCTRRARASSWASRCSTRSAPRWSATATRSSGPVLEVIRVPTYNDAVGLINDNPYGNGTAIFTRDGGAARQFQFEVNTGMVGINVPIPVPVAYYSFGGWKASLFGDLHMYGPEGIQFYTRAKIVTSRWPDPGTVQGRSRLPAHPLAETSMATEARPIPASAARRPGARARPWPARTTPPKPPGPRSGSGSGSGGWICIGRAEEIAEPGDYLVRDLAGESIVVTRNRDGDGPRLLQRVRPPRHEASRRRPRTAATSTRSSSARITPGRTTSTAGSSARPTSTRTKASSGATTRCTRSGRRRTPGSCS